MVAIYLHAILCRKPFYLWWHDTDSLCWRSFLLCFCRLWFKYIMLFGNYRPCLGFKSVQDTFRMTARIIYEVRGLEVLVELYVSIFRSVVINDWVYGVDHSPVLQILLQTFVNTSAIFLPPIWTRSVGILSTLANAPFFSAAIVNAVSGDGLAVGSFGWWSKSRTA